MKKLRYIISNGLLVILMSLCSCESWINVTPSDRLSEDMLFKDREGFVKALNGVYIELNTTQLYGLDLTAWDSITRIFHHHRTLFISI